MGTLAGFNLNDYNCDVYVETGTGRCVTLSKAMQCFDRCYSVDLDMSMVITARDRFPSAKIASGLSTIVLEDWLKNELSQDDRVFFFLDAHFPGADYYGIKHDVSAPNAVPLREELTLIQRYRNQCKDYIVCDDARIYTLGNFAHGNTEWLQVPGGFAFVHDLFPDAKISLEFQEEGYIVIDKR